MKEDGAGVEFGRGGAAEAMSREAIGQRLIAIVCASELPRFLAGDRAAGLTGADFAACASRLRGNRDTAPGNAATGAGGYRAAPNLGSGRRDGNQAEGGSEKQDTHLHSPERAIAAALRECYHRSNDAPIRRKAAYPRDRALPGPRRPTRPAGRTARPPAPPAPCRAVGRRPAKHRESRGGRRHSVR